MTLIKKCGVSTEISKKKLQVTTKSGIKIILHQYLTKNFRKNEQVLRYRRLTHNVFGDTFIADTTSKCGNKYAEVFATNFGYTREFTMKRNYETH